MARITRRDNGDMVTLVFSVPREEIVYLRFVLESYDGLGTQTSMAGSDLVEWHVPRSQADGAERLIHALLEELSC